MENNIETIVFGGGCFWCTEAIFKMLKGVESVTPGYAGGTVDNPTSEQVYTGKTGHAECVQIKFDPDHISLRNLLTVFFGSHDPTSLNRQGYDVGTEYRSIIFYTDTSQKEEIEKFIRELNASSAFGKPIVTEVVPLEKFYEADSSHKDFYEKHPENRYCEVIINPKLEKVQKEFAELLKNNNFKNI